MRLLNTTTRRFLQSSSDACAGYAIFSHTWGQAEDEVSFQDMERGIAETKPGYQKVFNICERAKADGHQSIWIDTCCIDKSSSAELSEAINSMYKWYSDATICYAYLDDVPAPNSRTHLFSTFEKSRWFERGWTLQELIAPKNLMFLTKDWKEIGSKSTFPIKLSEITGIDLGILTGATNLESMSVAKKMSWASRRKTTRKEDIAYCLMGLFNVNMPMLYGEGSRAFIRLQEEIMRYSDDQSLFAWEDHRPDVPNDACCGLLAAHPRMFAGSSKIEPYGDWERRVPYSMSNRGLRIDLHLSRLKQDVYIAALDCPALNDYECCLGIYLQRISAGDCQYARIRSSEICNIFERGSPQTVYVRQNLDGMPTSHAIQLRKGPDVDNYKLLNLVPTSSAGFKSLEPARARSWVHKGLPLAFQVAREAAKVSAILWFQHKNEEGIVVTLGSRLDTGVGFDAMYAEHFEGDQRTALEHFTPKTPGTYVDVSEHRVRVDAESHVRSGRVYYMIDIAIEQREISTSEMIGDLLDQLVPAPVERVLFNQAKPRRKWRSLLGI